MSVEVRCPMKAKEYEGAYPARLFQLGVWFLAVGMGSLSSVNVMR